MPYSSASGTDIRPVTVGRLRVRAIRPSISRSMMLLITHPDATTRATPSATSAPRNQSTFPWEASKKPPVTAIRLPITMPGFVSCR
jgi:hypothetical protein